MTNKDIRFVFADYWTMLYIDGELVFQDHRLDADDLLDILGIPYKYLGLEHTALESDEWDRVTDTRVPLEDAREFFNANKEYGDDI